MENIETTVLYNIPIGIIQYTDDKELIYKNRYAINNMGISSYKQYKSFIHEDYLENEIIYNKKFIEYDIETKSVNKMFNPTFDEYRWVFTSRIKNSEMYIIMFQDVHKIKMLEFEIKNEKIKTIDAYKHKTLFFANMSHEIRTPLNGIIGMLTLLEDTKLTPDQYDYILMVKECSYSLMTIINDILDYSKLELGKITLEYKPVNIRECIESVNDIILSKVYEKKIEYNTNINIDVPTSLIIDNNRLKQILLNLITNSIKFTNDGSIKLEIEKISYNEYIKLQDEYSFTTDQLKKETNDKIYLRFNVIDTGCGIHQDDKYKLFNSFTQIDNDTTTKIYQGTGLGLVISKELVKMMNGFIWLDWSYIHKGSKFSFVICGNLNKEEDENEEFEQGEQDILKNKNVLILDDNMYNRITLLGFTNKWGMKSQSFSNSEEALFVAKISKFDIGLIDLCMPKIDGLGFSTRLKDQLGDKMFPLVALSSLGEKSNMLNKNFKNHILKPVKEKRLKKICIDILNNNKNYDFVEQNLEQPPSNDKSVKILIAEDVYINQRVLDSFLAKIGYIDNKIVDNGEKCLNEVYNNDYDLILLDIKMPILDGEEVVKKLIQYYSSTKNRKKPYIVAVTAYCLLDDKTKYIQLGFDDYIAKPIKLEDLKKCMDIFVKNQFDV